MAAHVIVDCQNLKKNLVASLVGKASAHHHIRSNGCGVTAFNSIQNSGQLPPWIFKI